ncbi:MAG: hypothetical protein K5694_00635 [Bacilli bacterium]|nr:hypothetical protein [Bacilli bacterium]
MEFWTSCSTFESFLVKPDTGTFEDRSIDLITGDFNENNPAYITVLQEYVSTQVRDNYTVTVDNVEENLYTKDATQYTIGASTFRSIWDDDKVYLFVNLGEGVNSLTVTFGTQTQVLTATTELEFTVDGISDTTDIPVSFKEVTATTTVTYGGYLHADLNANNNAAHPRKLFTAKHTDTEPTIDGVLDDIYTASGNQAIVADVENDGGTFDTVTAYMIWDDDALYIHMRVYDINIEDQNDPWEPWRTDRDSVILYLSTCQTLPVASVDWGEANRPSANYVGELALYRRPGNPGDTFHAAHWMWDYMRYNGIELKHASISPHLPKEGYALEKDTYTIEFKIPWIAHPDDSTVRTFYDVENKYNQIIDFSIDVNDGDAEKNVRNGVRSTNNGNHLISRGSPANLQYLDQLKLIA